MANIAFERVSRRAFLTASAGAAAWLAARPLASWGLQTPNQNNLATLTLREASDLIGNGEVSPVDLTEACLDRIAEHESRVNSFITLRAEEALLEAQELEAELQSGNRRGPLHGIPIALKDNIDTAGIRTTAASELFIDRIPSEDAEVVRRLKDAGVILLGKQNLHEFAYGGTSTVTYFGAVHNPWALDHIAGGSSGGPAAGVAADLCFGSLGTDTAGSVRIPAAYCGIVGLKPTYGRVSIRGVIPLSWTLDHVGPITKSVEDAALMLDAIAGYDPREPTSVDRRVPNFASAIGTATSHLRVGVPRPSTLFEELDPEVASAFERAVGVLATLGAGARDIDYQDVSSGNILRVDARAYHSQWIDESPEKYQENTRNALRNSANASGAAYAEARRQVDLLRRDIGLVFRDVDLLVTPTMKGPAPPIDANGFGSANTSQFNASGLPAISVPCGFTVDGLPIGLQIVGAPFAESNVLALAHAYEQATSWHNRRPPLV